MLHITTIHVTRTDPKLHDLGVDTEEDKFFKFQFDVNDIVYHHEYEYELDDTTKHGTIIFFEDGMQIQSIEPFEVFSDLRMKQEEL